LPDFSENFVLDTDASDVGIGAVLSQKHADGSERVIAYVSRVLSKPERYYCVTRKELLAVCQTFPSVSVRKTVYFENRPQFLDMAVQLQES